MLSRNQKVAYSVLIVIGVIILAALTWMTISSNESTTIEVPGTSDTRNDANQKVLEALDQSAITDEPGNELLRSLIEESFDWEGELEDVSGGNASGKAMAKFRSSTRYQMLAEFDNLPPLEDDFFYEGWVVRKEPFAFISTGALEQVDGKWYNAFESNTDYTDYNRYVLTLEPDDGDPAPAEHIVEGDMSEVAGVK